jgi:hypothetical protein
MNQHTPLPSSNVREISNSYFVVMIDYGRRGREAIVDPEITRNGTISRIRSGEYKNILFIHEVNEADGHMVVSNVTDELMTEAGADDRVFA